MTEKTKVEKLETAVMRAYKRIEEKHGYHAEFEVNKDRKSISSDLTI